MNNTFYNTLFLFGKKFNDDFFKTKKFPFKLEKDSNEDILMLTDKLQPYTPKQVTSNYMRYVKEQADNLLGKPTKKVVLSIPSFINDQGKEQMKESFKDAGLEIVEFINESVSAGYAYNLEKNNNIKNFIVFSFSGSNFSLSYLTKKDGNLSENNSKLDKKENEEINAKEEVKRDIFETKYEIFDYSIGGDV